MIQESVLGLACEKPYARPAGRPSPLPHGSAGRGTLVNFAIDLACRLRYRRGALQVYQMSTTIPEIQLFIPRELRALYGAAGPGGEPSVRLPAKDVRGLLAELARRHPQVYVRLCDECGQPRQHINVFVNDDHVRTRAGLETPLVAGDMVTILPAVSGG